MSKTLKELLGFSPPEPEKSSEDEEKEHFKRVKEKVEELRGLNKMYPYMVAPALPSLPNIPPLPGASSMDINELLKAMGGLPPADSPPEYAAARAAGKMVMLQEVDNPKEYRFIRAEEIESICPHNEGSIIKTRAGDFHRTKASPSEVAEAMRRTN